MDRKAIFSDIYRSHSWGGASVSGPGSTLDTTDPLRGALPQAFEALGIRALIDAPCGTAEWITEVTGPLETYLGFDIVPDVVKDASVRVDRPNHFFMVADVIDYMFPKADAIFCRDCLVHLPLSAGLKTIANFKASGSRYLMATTFPAFETNADIKVGGWRPLNLQSAPFNFPPAMMLLPDRKPTPGDRYASKSIGVWRLEEL